MQNLDYQLFILLMPFPAFDGFTVMKMESDVYRRPFFYCWTRPPFSNCLRGRLIFPTWWVVGWPCGCGARATGSKTFRRGAKEMGLSQQSVPYSPITQCRRLSSLHATSRVKKISTVSINHNSPVAQKCPRSFV